MTSANQSKSGAEAPAKRHRSHHHGAESHEPARVSDWIRAGLPLVALALFIILAWRHGYFDLKNPQKLGAAAARVQDIPWLGPIFVAVYAGLAMLAAPVSPLAYGAGAVFGVMRGTLYVLIASLIGASAGYYLARSAWSGVARRLLGRFHTKLSDLRHGSVFLTTMRLQLLPIMPFGIFNYGAGVAHLPFLPFLAGTAVGILPGTVAAVYVGERVMAGITQSDRRAFVVAGLVVAALFALSFAPTLIKKLRGANDDD
ncbi:MAG TPA: VTT domain-containing protein [Gemmatimonadaceae bacterium]|nr:VTT domain-containing protein [Gemmatimonadaceae bacterium]